MESGIGLGIVTCLGFAMIFYRLPLTWRWGIIKGGAWSDVIGTGLTFGLLSLGTSNSLVGMWGAAVAALIISLFLFVQEKAGLCPPAPKTVQKFQRWRARNR